MMIRVTAEVTGPEEMKPVKHVIHVPDDVRDRFDIEDQVERWLKKQYPGSIVELKEAKHEFNFDPNFVVGKNDSQQSDWITPFGPSHLMEDKAIELAKENLAIEDWEDNPKN